MKISKREKNMLIILVIIVFIAAYYQFLYSPQSKKIKELGVKLEEYENLSIIYKTKASPNNKIYKDFKILNSEVELITKRFFPLIIQEKIILRLNEMINDSELDAASIVFSEIEIGSIEMIENEESAGTKLDEYVNAYHNQSVEKKAGEKVENSGEEQGEEDTRDESIERMTVTLTYKGDYKKVKSFINNIQSSTKEIIIKNLSISKDEEEGLSGNIVLDYYVIPHINQSNDDYFKWDIENDYGKDNPFTYFEGYRVFGY